MYSYFVALCRRYTYVFPAIFILTGAGSQITQRVTVDRIRWVGATTVGHQLILTESTVGDTAKKVWQSIAAGSEYVEESGALSGQSLPNGIRVGTIGSGEVWVYTKPPHCGAGDCGAHSVVAP